MAQETAGTIGIPVIRNEILPAIVDYGRRRQRAEELAAQRQQRAELAAAKREEQLASAFKMQTGRGRLFGHLDDADNKADIQEGINFFKSGIGTASDRILAVNDLQSRLNARKALSEGLDKDYEETLKGLGKSYVKMDYPTMDEWAKQQTKRKSAYEFAEEVKNNPAFVDLSKMGEAAKDYGTYEYAFRDKQGNERKMTKSPLFEYKMEKDPLFGVEVPKVSGVNAEVARSIIERDPEMQRAASVWIKKRKEDLTTLNPTADPILIEDAATNDFMKTAFGKYGEVKYGLSAPLPKQPSAGRKPPEDYSYTEKETIANISYLDDKDQKVKKTIKIGSSEDRGYPMSTTNHQAGLIGIPLGDIEEFGTLIQPNPDGTWTVNRTITYDNPIERKVYRATKSIRFFDANGNFLYKVDKGQILDNDDAGVVLSGPNPGLVKRYDGVEITARLKTPVTDEEKELKMWIRDADARSIKANIAKSQKGAKPKKQIKKISF